MKICPNCDYPLNDNTQTCPNCGCAYPEQNQDYDSNSDSSSDSGSDSYDGVFVLGLLSVILASISPILAMTGFASGLIGPFLAVIFCIAAIVLGINALHIDDSKSLPKVGIGLGIGFLVINLLLSMACASFCDGKSCTKYNCSIDGTQFNPFYKK